MEQKIIDFINYNEELIDYNDWEEVYRRANNEFFMYDVGTVTTILLNADIHPEDYLSELPRSFLSGKDIPSFKIPNNITSIGDYAFYNCTSLESIVMSNSLTSIGNYAFYECDSLTSITIGNGVELINDGAFSQCGNKVVISFSGTKAEWEDVYNSKAFTSTFFTVHCTDGDIVK